MDRETFISFDDYRDRATGANVDMRPASEILAELDEIEKEFTKGGDADGNGDI